MEECKAGEKSCPSFRLIQLDTLESHDRETGEYEFGGVLEHEQAGFLRHELTQAYCRREPVVVVGQHELSKLSRKAQAMLLGMFKQFEVGLYIGGMHDYHMTHVRHDFGAT